MQLEAINNKKIEVIKNIVLPIKLRCLVFTFGLVILSIGITFTILSKSLGVSSWDVLHLGLMNYLPFSYGQIAIGVGAVILSLSAVLGVRTRFGTLLNMVMVSLLIDFILNINLISIPDNIWLKATYLGLGIVLVGIGTGLYVAAEFGAGPRDSLMIAIKNKLKISIGWARTFLEILAVGIGFFLGGPVGIGTIILSLTVGFFVELTLNFYNRFIPKIVRNASEVIKPEKGK